MENLFLVSLIAAIAFWLGRQTKHSRSSSNNVFAHSAIQSTASLTGTETPHIRMNGQRAFALIFVSGWLIAWSTGIVMAMILFLSSLGSGLASVFIAGWLIAAIAGWFYAASTIYKLATGKPVNLRGGRAI